MRGLNWLPTKLMLAAWLSLPVAGWADEPVPLAALDLSKMTSGWGKPKIGKSVVGKPLSIGGQRFAHGVGTHAESVLHVRLDGKTERFKALVGVDDETGGQGSVRFLIFADGRTLFDSGVMRGGQPAKPVDVDLRGVKHLILQVTPAGDDIHSDHADWAEAVFLVRGEKPRATDRPVVSEPKVLLTPRPGPEPRINGPRLFGVRPGRPFLYRIPCTGRRPMRFAVDGLPEGLSVDPDTGIMTGRVPNEPGKYQVILRAQNHCGQAQKTFTIVVGETLALTPPMGWNSWYIHYHRVTDKVMREAADQMVASGMADYGYMYVNIDDCWMRIEPERYPRVQKRFHGFDMTGVVGKTRDANGKILPNKHFPDMKAMTDYIHAKGLRAGIYTSPGPRTCQGYAGAYGHERQDAEQFARWGFDFLKYDWCSYEQIYRERMKRGGVDLTERKRPYQQMGAILRTLDRDLVFNLCQYGMSEVWKWGAEVGGHSWRTTGDLGLHPGDRLPGFYAIGMSNARHWQYAGPGHWNDPDYILTGWVGSARGHGIGKLTTLTANEQYSYMSMWSLMAAPLFFSGDMAKLDEFTLNVLCNAEVIEINQDALGRQARPVRLDEQTLILAKPMEDGSLAVGLFNLLETARRMTVSWDQLQIRGPWRVRDVWRQKDLGTASGRYEVEVPRHGVMLVRLWPL
ncbi:MAG TPA: alpha-galactosidase [Planctomycetaceae bacterium]|nr:alpha-galactosidase [Planctomycetaceae bacterium]